MVLPIFFYFCCAACWKSIHASCTVVTSATPSMVLQFFRELACVDSTINAVVQLLVLIVLLSYFQLFETPGGAKWFERLSNCYVTFFPTVFLCFCFETTYVL